MTTKKQEETVQGPYEFVVFGNYEMIVNTKIFELGPEDIEKPRKKAITQVITPRKTYTRSDTPSKALDNV
jgi:hypothetical protein